MRIRSLFVLFLLCWWSVSVQAQTQAQEVDDIRNLLNQLRLQSGVKDEYQQNFFLDQSSRSHCLYWAENFHWLNPIKQQGILNFHHQVASIEDGRVTLVDGGSLVRINREGYDYSVSENVAQGPFNYRVAIHQLMASLGHRMNFLRTDWTDLGFHHCKIKISNPVTGDEFFVFQMGSRKDRVKQEALGALCNTPGTDVCPDDEMDCNRGFPCSNGSLVLLEWFWPEVERRYKSQTEGVIIYPGDHAENVMPVAQNIREFDPEHRLERGTVISADFLPDTLEQLAGEPVATLTDKYGVSQQLREIDRSFLKSYSPGLRAWFAEQPLDWKESYTSEIKYTLRDGEEKTVTSRFSTYAPGDYVVKVTDRKQHIKVKKGSVVTLLFSRDVFSRADMDTLQTLRDKSPVCTDDCLPNRSIEFVDNRDTVEFHESTYYTSDEGNMFVTIEVE